MILFIHKLLTLFFAVYKNHPRDFHMSSTTRLSRKSRAHGVNDFGLLNKPERKNHKTMIFYPFGYSQTRASLEISQNCRFLKENNFLFSFLCANNGCKHLLDEDIKKSLCLSLAT